MKAVAVYPRQANSAHLADIPEPSIEDGRGVLVRVLRVGLDGTDKEIDAGEYGAAPEGSDVLVLGHEGIGVVEAVGDAVHELRAGDVVVARVRQARGSSVYDALDMPDFTTDDDYFEHGISKVHGFLTERYVEDASRLTKLPASLQDVGVLLEPTSVVEKGILQAFEIQRRLKVWQPKRAAVLGAGTIGLLATMVLRNRGLEVLTFGRDTGPSLNQDLVEALGATYVATEGKPLSDLGKGKFDLVFEATGYSPLVFEAMCVILAKNGVLVVSSVTGGDKVVDVPADAINLDFVLGNKVMVGTVNANREHFEAGVRDLVMAESSFPGWLSRLITHRVTGLDSFREALGLLGSPGAVKVVLEVS